MNTSATQNITILHDAKEWSTDLDGEIGEIRVDGKRLNDIHDMATKIIQQISDEYFENYAVVAYTQKVNVVRGEKYMA